MARKEKQNNEDKSPGSANKAIETMFRNAYRAQLDLLALAATKANIMISINGAIVSILVVASGFVYTDVKSPTMLFPAALFLITSVVSIYFALSAASPSPSPVHTRIGQYLNNITKGNFNFKKIRQEIVESIHQFNKESSDILIFENFSKLSKADYLRQMDEFIRDKDKIYNEMSAQLYHLGTMADRKFSMLRLSYSVFRWGLIVSILVLLLQYFSSTEGVLLSAPPPLSSKEQLSINSNEQAPQKITSIPAVSLKLGSGILQFNSLYEPSGVQQLADGRLVVVEDEPSRAFRILTPSVNKILESKPLDIFSELAFRRKLNDLEAITMGKDGFLYAITSHKRNNNGKRKKSREQLIRFKIKGNRLTNASIATSLVDAIDSSGVLDKITKMGKKSIEKIDIEALSFDANNNLLIGLRKPKARGKSIILKIKNPTRIFNDKEKIQIAKKPILLDLHGEGLRAMRYIPRLKGYLLANETKKKGSRLKEYSQLLYWNGNPDDLVKLLTLQGVDKIDNIEGISSLIIGGKEYILLLGDNGNSETQQPATFLLLEYI
ncbi:MAG: DUF3616 domain-containing protein [Cocleimonas sp.]|nr:DUF3616 domain-containing protein [Cocleimonas sp.]